MCGITGRGSDGGSAGDGAVVSVDVAGITSSTGRAGGDSGSGTVFEGRSTAGSVVRYGEWPMMPVLMQHTALQSRSDSVTRNVSMAESCDSVAQHVPGYDAPLPAETFIQCGDLVEHQDAVVVLGVEVLLLQLGFVLGEDLG